MNIKSTFPDEQEIFINEKTIWEDIEDASAPAPQRVQETLDKARQSKGLTPAEAAILLKNTDKELDQALFDTAIAVKKSIYGNRLVLFAPMYITNECANQCLYCGFKATNSKLKRRTLAPPAIRKEVEILEKMGHKRLLLVYGEHPRFGADWIAQTMEDVYSVTSDKSGQIRRVNVNCAPMGIEGFKQLRDVGIGTYQCFQETYHRPTYEKMHPHGTKANYMWRLQTMHRAQEAGIDDIGMGALFGLFDPVFEVLGLLYHALELEKEYGVGPHTISFPRLEPAMDSDISITPPYSISDHEFKKIVAVLRLAAPYTGLILTTREKTALRKELIEIGVSQLSAGSRTYPGAYSDSENSRPDVQQFCVDDNRSLDEVIRSIVSEHGYVPSWCTACYRLGRTGHHFMELAKKGFIQKFCAPNSLLTFKEYLEDYASDATRKVGEKLIHKELESLTAVDNTLGERVKERLSRIERGERDIYI